MCRYLLQRFQFHRCISSGVSAAASMAAVSTSAAASVASHPPVAASAAAVALHCSHESCFAAAVSCSHAPCCCSSVFYRCALARHSLCCSHLSLRRSCFPRSCCCQVVRSNKHRCCCSPLCRRLVSCAPTDVPSPSLLLLQQQQTLPKKQQRHWNTEKKKKTKKKEKKIKKKEKKKTQTSHVVQQQLRQQQDEFFRSPLSDTPHQQQQQQRHPISRGDLYESCWQQEQQTVSSLAPLLPSLAAKRNEHVAVSRRREKGKPAACVVSKSGSREPDDAPALVQQQQRNVHCRRAATAIEEAARSGAALPLCCDKPLLLRLSLCRTADCPQLVHHLDFCTFLF